MAIRIEIKAATENQTKLPVYVRYDDVVDSCDSRDHVKIPKWSYFISSHTFPDDDDDEEDDDGEDANGREANDGESCKNIDDPDRAK